MSFDIFLHACERGQPHGVPLSLVESAFAGAIVHREACGDGLFWRLEYPALDADGHPETVQIEGVDEPVLVQDRAEVYIGQLTDGEEGPLTDGFMVSGPAAHLDFYRGLLMLLQTVHSALFWPGDNSLVVGQLESIAHLPQGMVESLGEPFLVTEPQQIIDRIRAS